MRVSADEMEARVRGGVACDMLQTIDRVASHDEEPATTVDEVGRANEALVAGLRSRDRTRSISQVQSYDLQQ